MLRSGIARLVFPQQTESPQSIIEELLIKRMEWVLQQSLGNLITDSNHPSAFQTVRKKNMNRCSEGFDQHFGCF